MPIWILEIIGVISSLLFVYLNGRENIWCWLFGFISSVAYLSIFFISKLYGDSILQGYYLIMAIYGWYSWSRNQAKAESLVIRNMDPMKFLFWVGIGGVLSPLAGYYLDSFTDSDIPYWDGLTTIYSFLATWMMTRKIIQNWVIWIVIDGICVGVYIYKDLWITAGLFVLFTAFAIYGLLNWRKELVAKEDEISD